MSPRPPEREGAFRRFARRAALLLGAGSLALGCFFLTLDDSVFDADAFGEHSAASLGDPRVAAFAADRIANAVLERSPDLTAVRPFILATAEGLTASEPFRALVRAAARSAHQAAFAEGTRQIVLSVPDVGVLLRAAFERASPQLAERIPDRLATTLASLGLTGTTEILVDLWRLRGELRALAFSLLLLAPALLAAGAWLAPDRRRGLVASGVALLCVGLLTAGALPTGSILIASTVADPLTSGALRGLWHSFLSGLTSWGLFLGGLGGLFAAAGTSLLEEIEPLSWLRQKAGSIAATPASRGGRLARGVALLGLGWIAVYAPESLLKAVMVAAGVVTGILGARELFRLLLDAVEPPLAVARSDVRQRSRLRAIALLALVAVLAGVWIWLRAPTAPTIPSRVATCNGHTALCERRVDEVTFAGAHNAMSNTAIPDWMFPHHEAGIVDQLRDGVRALLIDVHYGYPGGSRIKTDLDGGQRPTREVLEHALGEEGMEAALRIRDRLVGVDEGRRGVYLCHGFCELGAYELAPTLADIRTYLVQNPGEVLILVIEDYISPADLAQAFEQSRLAEFVYRGPSGPPWPTLRELIASGQRVVVFIESGSPGVDWLRPAFQLMQETPYTFHSPEEFSCRPNRGPADAGLFQLNHWIETTPAPRPSNAAIVNAGEVLLARAQQCREVRGLLPNIVAVDFYRTGDLLEVVDTLNGVENE